MAGLAHKSSSFYRSNDPVENFRLKLQVREKSRIPIAGEDGRKGDPLQKDVEIAWQEKKYGPGDIADYINSGDRKPKNANEHEARRRLSAMEESGKTVHSLLEDVMIYTYTDRDPRSPKSAPPVMLEDGIEDVTDTYVNLAMDGHFLEDGDLRSRKVRERIFREKPYKTMYVCMATDVDVDVIKDGPYNAEDHYTEHVLAIIRIFTDGLVEMTPQLSTVVEEVNGVASEITVPSLFLSDETVAAGLTTGMRLSAYRVRSKMGSEFEYTLSNSHTVTNPIELEEKLRVQEGKDALAVRHNRGGDLTADPSEWKQDPPSAKFDKSISYYGEIVSATGFDSDNLFVHYEVKVPDGWDLRTGNLSDGVAEQDMQDMVSAAQYSKDAELKAASKKLKMKMDLDGYADGDEAEGALRGITSTAKVSSRRGGLRLPILRPNWKGKSVPFALDEVSRAIWAAVFFFILVVSVILGMDYPIWIIPGLVFLFSIGTGYQGGPTQALLGPRDDGSLIDANGRYDLNYASSSSRAASKKGSSVHKMKGQKRTLTGPLVADPVANLNHLMNLSFDATDVDISKPHAMGATQVPTMVFTVYSRSYLGKINVEGYGYTHFPAGAGSLDINIKTWKPVGGVSAEMRNYFLGSGARLSDPGFVWGGSSNPDGGTAPKTTINRFGVRTENAGSIRFRCNVLVTDPRKVAEVETIDLAATNKVAAVRRTVDDILKEYRAGAGVAKSIEAASLKRGTILGSMGAHRSKDGSNSSSSSDLMRSSSNGSLLAKKAEMLIAQAKMRLSNNGSSMGASGLGSSRDMGAIARSVLGSSVSRSAEGLATQQAEGKDDPDDSTPLLGTREIKSSDSDSRATTGLGSSAQLAPLRGMQSKQSSNRRYDDDEKSEDSAEGLLSGVDGDDGTF